LAVKRPARPYKSAIENRFTMGNAKGSVNAPPGPGPLWKSVLVFSRPSHGP
jgi:hypothetical protein